MPFAVITISILDLCMGHMCCAMGAQAIMAIFRVNKTKFTTNALYRNMREDLNPHFSDIHEQNQYFSSSEHFVCHHGPQPLRSYIGCLCHASGTRD